MEGHASIERDVLATYAADAARDVAGVTGLVGSALHRHEGVRIAGGEGRELVELHLAVEWGANVPALGAEVQERVTAYLARMADLHPESVDVVVDEIGPPPAAA